MQILEYRLPEIDKMVAWGPGPWVDEPDKIQWPDEVTGLPCLVVRNHSGAWCGYVGVFEEHPHFGRVFETVSVTVHGGLTYSDFSRLLEPGREDGSVCHVVEEGENDRVWWLGFDCAHGWDAQPGLEKFMKGNLFNTPELLGRVYRTVDYAREECRKLALQLQSANDLRNGWQDGRA